MDSEYSSYNGSFSNSLADKVSDGNYDRDSFSDCVSDSYSVWFKILIQIFDFDSCQKSMLKGDEKSVYISNILLKLFFLIYILIRYLTYVSDSLLD